MGLKESLKELKEKEKLSVKREVKKELTKIKNNYKKLTAKQSKCIICQEPAKYFLKNTYKGYCKQCALDNFSDLDCLQKR